MTQEEYNEVPVFYCRKCLSLKIRDVEHIDNSEYCDDCGSTDIAEANIKDWDDLYVKRYGYHLTDKY